MISRLFLILVIAVTNNFLYADQTDDRLADLFATLQDTENVRTIQITESQIWEIWLQHANADVQQLMLVGTQRMNTQRYAEAMVVFNRLTESFPDYAIIAGNPAKQIGRVVMSENDISFDYTNVNEG